MWNHFKKQPCYTWKREHWHDSESLCVACISKILINRIIILNAGIANFRISCIGCMTLLFETFCDMPKSIIIILQIKFVRYSYLLKCYPVNNSKRHVYSDGNRTSQFHWKGSFLSYKAKPSSMELCVSSQWNILS